MTSGTPGTSGTDVDGVRRRVEVLISLGRADEAARVARSALAGAPHEADLWCALGHAEIARSRPGDALDAARQALAIDPDEEWPHRIASLAYSQLERHQEAAVEAQECVRL